MYEATTHANIRAGIEAAHRERAIAFRNLFRRTRPHRSGTVRFWGKAAA